MLGMPEILLILTLALLVFGPSKLPEMAKALGQAMREFRKASAEFEKQTQALENLPPPDAYLSQVSSPNERTEPVSTAPPNADKQEQLGSENVKTRGNKTLEVARILEINTEGKSDDQLRSEISEKLGGLEKKTMEV